MSLDLLEKYNRIDRFTFRGQEFAVRYAGTMAVAQGVECDTYLFENDDTRDLGIIKVQPGHHTPWQRIVGGEHTIEGYVAGRGVLLTGHTDFADARYEVDEASVGKDYVRPFEHEVPVGSIMQWAADLHIPLIASEVCYPPYADGRFENLQ